MSHDTFGELRRVIDGSDPFMTRGHQILKIRRPAKKTPLWAFNHKKIQTILLRSFPKMKTSPTQRARAGRWIRIIHLYFNQNWSRGQISAELRLSYPAVDSIIRAIKRAAAGLRTDTAAPMGNPRGRPVRKRMPA